MIRTSTFAKRQAIWTISLVDVAKQTRLFDEIEGIPPELRPFDRRLDTLALDGLSIQDDLIHWQQRSYSETLPTCPFTQLASILHRALSLYHCRNFIFYSCWMTRAIPRLSQSEVKEQVESILNLSENLLSMTYIPPVLFLFPLRMAGAYVSDGAIQNKVLGLVRKIRQKGFIISDIIEADLQECWQHQRQSKNSWCNTLTLNLTIYTTLDLFTNNFGHDFFDFMNGRLVFHQMTYVRCYTFIL